MASHSSTNCMQLAASLDSRVLGVVLPTRALACNCQRQTDTKNGFHTEGTENTEVRIVTLAQIVTLAKAGAYLGKTYREIFVPSR
ncbi:MAG TPA: hypothetical protein VFS47_10730 [Steroidobacteraceae bacterium]|nr:hypothetical protein [Steroidobacteraceae bacterium]